MNKTVRAIVTHGVAALLGAASLAACFYMRWGPEKVLDSTAYHFVGAKGMGCYLCTDNDADGVCDSWSIHAQLGEEQEHFLFAGVFRHEGQSTGISVDSYDEDPFCDVSLNKMPAREDRPARLLLQVHEAERRVSYYDFDADGYFDFESDPGTTETDRIRWGSEWHAVRAQCLAADAPEVIALDDGGDLEHLRFVNSTWEPMVVETEPDNE